MPRTYARFFDMPLTILVTDLIFSTKIISTAKALNIPFGVARTLDGLVERLSAAPGGTLIIDLAVTAVDPLAAIRTAKAMPNPPRIIGFLSHVEAELAAAAQAAGADLVLPRSAFTARLPALLASAR
jgi:DNA-binding NarL/FixJ family response regulator